MTAAGSDERLDEDGLELYGRAGEIPLPLRVVIGANGAYWRDFGSYYSMCVVSTDNDPVQEVASYVPEQEAARLRDGLRRIQSYCGLVNAAAGCRLILREARSLLSGGQAESTKCEVCGNQPAEYRGWTDDGSPIRTCQGCGAPE